MYGKWTHKLSDNAVSQKYTSYLYLVKANLPGERGSREHQVLIRSLQTDEKVLLAIPTGIPEGTTVTFLQAGKDSVLANQEHECFVDGLNEAYSQAKIEQKRLQEELDACLLNERSVESNPFIDAFEHMSGLEINRRYTGNSSYCRANEWGKLGAHSVVSVLFKSEQKRQYEKFPKVSDKIIQIAKDAIELLGVDYNLADVTEAIEIAKE